jgi:hypothetical protein
LNRSPERDSKTHIFTSDKAGGVALSIDKNELKDALREILEEAAAGRNRVDAQMRQKLKRRPGGVSGLIDFSDRTGADAEEKLEENRETESLRQSLLKVLGL